MIETLPVDELPAGKPDPRTPAQPARNKRGHYLPGAATKAAASRAAKARTGHTRLANTLAVSSDDPQWRSLQRQAEGFRRTHTAQLARDVGGGVCGPAAASLVGSAALALAGSRLAYSRGDLQLASRLANDSRQALLAAHELCAREAVARKVRPRWRPTSTPITTDDSEPDDDGTDAAFGQPEAATDAAEVQP